MDKEKELLVLLSDIIVWAGNGISPHVLDVKKTTICLGELIAELIDGRYPWDSRPPLLELKDDVLHWLAPGLRILRELGPLNDD